MPRDGDGGVISGRGRDGAVRERGIERGEVGGRLAARPGWLAAERERRRAQIARAADDRLRRDLADALVTSVQEVWFRELKHAVTGAVDGRWAPEVSRARRQARQLAGELAPEQVRARTGRGNGTPPTRRPGTGPGSSRGGHRGDDGGQVRDP